VGLGDPSGDCSIIEQFALTRAGSGYEETAAVSSGDAKRPGAWHHLDVPVRVTAIDHVQLAMPAGGEAEAEAFYCAMLGLEVRPKPPALAARGGRWFARGDVQVHLGVEEDFRPARKAHVALCVAGFDELLRALDNGGIGWRPDEDLPGARRIYVDDPFGNRLELIDAVGSDPVGERSGVTT
jgi:catechol 2,3-dioxygenase-like lactoylglutathione lyase family enzyme